MTGLQLISIGALLMLVLMMLNVPVFASVMGATLLYFLFNPEVQNVLFIQRIVAGMESIPLLAIPFFVGAGVFMNYTGVSDRVMKFCEVFVGHMAGGLAQVNVVLSTIMGGLSGSSLADAAMEAKMLVPAMEKAGMPKDFSTVVTGTSAVLTPIIPPGIAMILYGCIANVSIGKLFMSGIGLGLLGCVSMMIVVNIIAKKNHYPPSRESRATLKEIWVSLKDAIWALLLPVVLIGGIRLGIFTASEGGAVAVVYTLFLGVAIYRTIDLKTLIIGCKETVITTSSIMLIIGAASGFAWALTWERVPQAFTEMVVSVISSKYVFLIVINLFLLFVGMFVEGNAAMIVLIPLLKPIADYYGINEIHFAMMVIWNMAIGSISPPMGTLMYVSCGVTGCKIKDYIKASVPFYLWLLGVLLVVTFVPPVTTFLPDLLY
ncbi:MAG: TRAP transporter large permease [Eubacteriales bacterium]|jgi:tripartite ATP-independent transporter DctM subunit